jgi:hypothetical protein
MAIGTTAAILGSAALTAGAGALASNKAAKAQTSAANQATDAQLRMFEQQRADFEPWRETGQNALAALEYELGLGARPSFGAAALPEIQTVTNEGAIGLPYGLSDDRQWWENINGELVPIQPQRQTTTNYNVNGRSFNALADAEAFARQTAAAQPGMAYQGFQATPGYAFRVGEGTKAIERSAAARGGLNSGATMKALNRFGQDIAAEEYGNYINRLGTLAGTGQSATAQSAALGQNTANNVAQNALTAGAARGSAYLGMNNAFQGGIQNAMSLGARYGGWFE